MPQTTDKGESVFEQIASQTAFQTELCLRTEVPLHIMIKGAIQQEGVTLVNFYAPNIGALKHAKQILMDIKGDTDSNTVSVSPTPY